MYVPTPEEEIEELPLAPEDPAELQREAQLQEERLRLDSLIAHEADEGGVETSPGGGAGGGDWPRAGGRTGSDQPAGGATRMDAALSRYLVAMRDADFEAAERAIATLKLQPRVTRELIDRMATDSVPPPEMAQVPPGVFQGFLKNLRSRL